MSRTRPQCQSHGLRPLLPCAALLGSAVAGQSRTTIPANAQLVAPSAIPKFSTFFSLYKTKEPPLPFLKPMYAEAGLPVYWLGDSRYLVDDTSLDWAAIEAERLLQQAAAAAAARQSESGAGLMGCNYSSNDLWLEISAITNQTAVFTIHSPVTNGVYDLYFVPDLNYQRWQWRRVFCAAPSRTNFTLALPDPHQGYFVALDAADEDGDGLGNGYEGWFSYGSNHTSAANPFTDNDDLPDGWEVQYGLNPTSPDGENGNSGNHDGDTIEMGNGPELFVNKVEFMYYDTQFGPQDPLAQTDRPVVSVRALLPTAGCPRGAFTITRHIWPGVASNTPPLRVYYSVGGSLRYGVDYTLDPAPQTTSSDPDDPDGYPRIFFADIPAGQTSVTVTANRIGALTDDGPATLPVALTPYAVAPKVQVQEAAGWKYVVALDPLATHGDRVVVPLGSAMPAPTLTVECRRDRLVLNWIVPDWVASSGLVTDFRIYRCEGTGTTTNCTPTAATYHTADALSRFWVDDPQGGLDPAKHYCYAISFGFSDRCSMPNSPSESPVSAPVCAQLCEPPKTPTDIVFIVDNTASVDSSTTLAIVRSAISNALDDIVYAATTSSVPAYRLALVTPGNDQVHVRVTFDSQNRNNFSTAIAQLPDLGRPWGHWECESTDECIKTATEARQANDPSLFGCARHNDLDPSTLQIGHFIPPFANERRLIVLLTERPPGGFCDPSRNLSDPPMYDPNYHGAHARDIAGEAKGYGVKINAIQLHASDSDILGNEFRFMDSEATSIMEFYATRTCGWHSQIPVEAVHPPNSQSTNTIKEAILRMVYASTLPCPRIHTVMKSPVLFVVSQVITLELLLTFANAEVVFQHQGAINPVLEGFLPGIPSNARVGPATNDFGREAWFINAAFRPAGYIYHLDASLLGELAQTDWELAATLRLAKSEYADLALYLPTGRFSLAFGIQPDGDPIVFLDSATNPVWVYEGGGAEYHDYALLYNQEVGSASLIVDGVERISDITGQSGWNAWGASWGYNSQSSSSSLVYWSAVTLSVVPEPEAYSLFMFGLLGLWCFLASSRRGLANCCSGRRSPP